MSGLGILMHGRHLEARGWERLVWGVPEQDSLGSLPKVVELLLGESKSEPITTILFGCGPSFRDGLSEGEYGKRYLLSHIDDLVQFPRFASLSAMTLAQLRKRLEGIIIASPSTRSIDEVANAARIFQGHNVAKVLQVTAASHAPRCVQVQAAARALGFIPTTQQWFLVADDRCFEGADPFSTLIMEPPHRGDDPLLGFEPSVPELLRAYQYGLSPVNKKELARLVERFMNEHVEHSDIRNFSTSKELDQTKRPR